MNQKFDQSSQTSILSYAKKLVGKTLRNSDCVIPLDLNMIKMISGSKTKGRLGTLLESNFFGINPGNEATPDFEDAGLELKSHPIKRIKNGFSSKERLILGMIDYHELVKEDFLSSKFFYKNKDILLLSYLYEKEKLEIDYKFMLAEILSYENFSEIDKAIILDDWNKIKDKVERGLAHELSEGDTMYLGAVTKSASSKNRRTQPNGPEAKPRAFSYKNGFMTYKIRSFLDKQLEENDLDFSVNLNKSFDDFIYEKIKPYIGKSISELGNIYGKEIDSKNKSYNRLLIQRILGSKKNKIPEFEKADVTLRVIRLDKNNKPKEDVSFPAFKFQEIVETKEWEQSDFYNQLNSRFLFVFFKENSRGEFILDSYRFWNMPIKDLLEAQRVWNLTRRVINSGEIVRDIRKNKRGKEIVYNNFPGTKDSYAVHVRPHGRNKQDTFPLVVFDVFTKQTEFTKQCFWLNKNYIRDYIYKKTDYK